MMIASKPRLLYERRGLALYYYVEVNLLWKLFDGNLMEGIFNMTDQALGASKRASCKLIFGGKILFEKINASRY
jgi:hypothetical protein